MHVSEWAPALVAVLLALAIIASIALCRKTETEIRKDKEGFMFRFRSEK